MLIVLDWNQLNGDGALPFDSGCIWDGSGCHEDCDEEAMEQRCSKLNHDMDTCNSDIGEYNRCVWSHGVNYNAKSKSHKRAVIAEEVGMEAVSKGSSYDKHHDVDSKEMKKEEITARLGMRQWLCHEMSTLSFCRCPFHFDVLSISILISFWFWSSGCIWDQTGCSNGCDVEAMDERCDRMSHDQVPRI